MIKAIEAPAIQNKHEKKKKCLKQFLLRNSEYLRQRIFIETEFSGEGEPNARPNVSEIIAEDPKIDPVLVTSNRLYVISHAKISLAVWDAVFFQECS